MLSEGSDCSWRLAMVLWTRTRISERVDVAWLARSWIVEYWWSFDVEHEADSAAGSTCPASLEASLPPVPSLL